MAYWRCDDNEFCIRVGAQNGVEYRHVIQRDDNHGGYNAEFYINNTGSSYHIHFRRGGTRVTAVNYYAQRTQTSGQQIYADDIQNARTLREIISNDLEPTHFQNHHQLFNHFRSVVNNTAKRRDHELE